MSNLAVENWIAVRNLQSTVDSALKHMRLSDVNGIRQKLSASVATADRLKGVLSPSGADERTGPFETLGDQLLATVRASYGDQAAIRELHEVENRVLGLNQQIGSEGGFLVGEDFAIDLLTRVYDTGVIAGMTSRIPISARSNKVRIATFDETSRAHGSRFGGLQVYWSHESEAIAAASKPRFKQLTLTPQKLIGLCYCTDENLQDAPALEAVLMEAFRLEFTFRLELAMLFGTGAGELLGVMNSGALITVSKENGQAAATLLPQNIVNMWSRCWGPSRKNAVWLVNQDIDPQLYTMSWTVGAGGAPIFTPAGEAGSPYALLFGRPVVPVEYCPTVGTTGDIILGDFSRYLIADKGGIRMIPSIHVQFLTDETAFKFVMRVDGQPLESSPLMPLHGVNDLTSFVCLESRV